MQKWYELFDAVHEKNKKQNKNKKKTNKQTRSGVLQYEHRADGGFILLDWSRNMRGEVRGRELNAI